MRRAWLALPSCNATSSCVQLASKKASLGSAEKAPLIIIHGLFGSSNNWWGISRALSARTNRTSYAVDLRNHGRSPHHPSMTYCEMDADLNACVEAVAGVGDDSKVILMGHSLGGKVAMQYALRHPGRVQGLLVVDAAPVRYTSSFQEMRQVIHELNGLDLSGVKTLQQAAAKVKALPCDQGIQDLLIANLITRVQSGEVRWKFNLHSISKSMRELRSFPLPDRYVSSDVNTLFVCGEKSTYVKAKHYPVIHQYFPKAAVTTIKDAAHWVHVDQPEEFLRVCGEFIEHLDANMSYSYP
eukprot:NODE_3862_length_1152_cov_144.230321_g3675_i0.p1 GENE.NODE_3862_length_1152_cov_144.230321_g3675_i0~~NODE_3862_length_1152_cov_144.230321_g3675_i0.p1  ORF type:complete len:298 (+),score=28.77 NODE_3862_length_1152_cov_144.230321_g3675_i0:72-965(+)